MTTLIRGDNSYFFGAQAFVLDDAELERDVASEWAGKHVEKNPALKWILGRFVEADNPNRNKQAWALEDLRLKRPTINHAPMNMVHQARNVVGAFVATELLYPTEDVAGDVVQHPHIEALGAFWRYYFPEEFNLVQKAHDEGSLFFSQECIAETTRFEDPETGETETFPYRGPRDDSYGDWNDRVGATKWLDNPHFLGGALILPPFRPGWANADVTTLSQYVDAHSELADSVFTSVADQAPHLSADQIEGITLGLIKGQIKEEWAELVENSNSSVHLSKKDTEPSTDGEASVSHPLEVNMDKTYTEQEVSEAVEKALAPLRVELDALKAAADAEVANAQVAELETAHAAALAEIQQKLDEATIKADTAATERDEVIAYLTAEKTAAEEAAARVARTDERLAAVAEVASFDETFVAENTERWVSMSDEDFGATVAGYKAAVEAAKAPVEKSTEKVDLTTALAGERSTSSATSSDRMAGVREMLALRSQGVDPRTV